MAPDRTVTDPLNTTTSPSTVPEISVRPLNTTRDSVTVPSIEAGPLKITALSTVSPSATRSRPLSTICSSFGSVSASWADAGNASASDAATVSASIVATRRNVDRR